ncbi:hypothetical protein OSB04_003718 [Centaurea solstitialis]|uniref:CAP-Gly domain-containing protein n=1 Tax=Centaurea solstitialis TaxID=347529 RepID=A0AA38WNG6_9ASTR|nr:hypothetical protein OSB04_003718 [Centaurea solstitialis]
MGFSKDQLLERLQAQKIQFSKYDHPVVMTVEAQAKYVGHIKGGLSKNLFLKDKKHRYYIVSALADTKVDLKVLSIRLGLGKGGLRMAPEEAIADILQVPLGSVTPFALLNESARHVSLLLDQGFKTQECCFFHPLSNDVSITLCIQDLDMFLKSVGRTVAYVDLEANPPVGKDQPPDLAALVPSDTLNISDVVEKTASLQVDSGVNSKPASVTAKAPKLSSGPQKEKLASPAKSSSSFADPEKLIEQILEKTSAIILSEIKEESIKQHGEQLGAVVSSSIKKNLSLELKSLATMFKNTAYTEGFGAVTTHHQRSPELYTTRSILGLKMQSSTTAMANPQQCDFKIGQRVHWAGDCRRIGTVKYVGPVQGYSGDWIGVEWDNRDGKHDGSLNGVRYFDAQFPDSASFARPHNLSSGVSLLQALDIRYRTSSTKEEEDEMYVFSANNKRVSVQLVGKDKIEDQLGRFEELPGASLFYLGVSSSGDPVQISKTLPKLKELDLTGNLLSEWQDVAAICSGLPALTALNLSSNTMSQSVVGISHLTNLRLLVLNNTGINWSQIEVLKDSLQSIEELHLMGNKLREITTTSSNIVQGFGSLRLLNLEDNYIADWGEILKLSQLKCLEQLHLNKNSLQRIWYPAADEFPYSSGSPDKSYKPFQNFRCLLIGANKIEDVASIDALNSYPSLVDIRCSENPATDPRSGGVARFVLIARLAKVEVLNGSEITPRERKDSEIRYVRLVMSKPHQNLEEIKKLHPRFTELKAFHGIEDERPSNGPTGPQKMASGLITVTLKCVGPSIGEKAPLTKKLPAITTVGKLKTLCESFFKLKSIKPLLYLQEEGSPLPTLLDDDMASLNDAGVCTQSTILVDEET